MRKLHVTQDKFGFWLLSLEDHDGSLRLLAHRAESPEHIIETAHELVLDGKYPGAVVVVDPPRVMSAAASATDATLNPDDYTMPAPRKAGE